MVPEDVSTPAPLAALRVDARRIRRSIRRGIRRSPSRPCVPRLEVAPYALSLYRQLAIAASVGPFDSK